MEIYIVINEDYFGGENKFIRAFSTEERAVNYLKTLNNNKLQILILTAKLDSENCPSQKEADYEGYVNEESISDED